MTFLKLCVNVMNRNIKIQNIFYIVRVLKSIQPSSCISLLKTFFYVFPIF
jgi:hypothetical protein